MGQDRTKDDMAKQSTGRRHMAQSSQSAHNNTSYNDTSTSVLRKRGRPPKYRSTEKENCPSLFVTSIQNNSPLLDSNQSSSNQVLHTTLPLSCITNKDPSSSVVRKRGRSPKYHPTEKENYPSLLVTDVQDNTPPDSNQSSSNRVPDTTPTLSCITNKAQVTNIIQSSKSSPVFRKRGRPPKYQPTGKENSPSLFVTPDQNNSPLDRTPLNSVNKHNNSVSAVSRTQGGRPPKFNITSRSSIPFCLSPDTNHQNNSDHTHHVAKRGRPRKYPLSPEEILPSSVYTTDPVQETSIRNKFQGISKAYRDIGDPIYVCQSCRAKLWKCEAIRGNKSLSKRSYSICCSNGKVQLPKLAHPPPMIMDLLSGNTDKCKNFQENIRRYNMMFSFTSMGGKLDHSITTGRGPYTYRLHGQNYHLAGSLLPNDGDTAKFCQLYIFDTDNEVENRMTAFGSKKDSTALKSYRIDDDIVLRLKGLLDVINPLVRTFRMARDRFVSNQEEPIRLKLIGSRDRDGRTYNLPTANEVAALIVGDVDGTADQRDIILETKTKKLQRISELHPQYLPLQYPILFPYAEDGYRTDILHNGIDDENQSGHIRLTIREFFSYRLQMRVDELSLILLSRKLLQQFIVDAYTMMENARLKFIRYNQKTLRVSSYRNLYDVQDDASLSDIGNRVILPSSFTGGARYMQQNYLDAMAIVKTFGYPDLFITLTCNPKWPEILRILENDKLNPEDRPDLITRVFKIKLDSLMYQIKDEKVLGSVAAVVYTIEFQKRGLPHCHMCLFFDKQDKLPRPADIDRVISAEIPDKDEDPELYSIVSDFMVHGPCGKDNPYSPCMKRDKCSKHFPRDWNDDTYIDEDGYPCYRRRDNGRYIMKGTVRLDNRNIVGYNPTLLRQYQAHMNVEWCNQIGSIKYLFKYINKGPDRITLSFQVNNPDNSSNQPIQIQNKDEIKEYYSCRYISACEACWRLFEFDIVYRTPAVYRLAFHLPDHQPIVYDVHDDIDSVLSKCSVGHSQFIEWMELNKVDPEARELTYVELPGYYVWNAKDRIWTRRVGPKSVGRINFVPPKAGETYYLRILLNKVRGAMSFVDIRTVYEKVYDTFKDACYARGLLDDDKEYVECIKETFEWASGIFCRSLFVYLITSDSLTRPDVVWQKTCDWLSEDLKHKCHPSILKKGGDDLKAVLHNLALADIENKLRSSGMSLQNIPNMPYPEFDFIDRTCNMLIHSELDYDKPAVEEEHSLLFSKMTVEQKSVYNTVIDAVFSDDGGIFFLYGYGGTGKTFVWKTLAAALRAKGEIVINVASSGIAALLLTGGRTAHSRFAIPINLTEKSFCSVTPGSDLAGLLNSAKLIIWDEAPMMHRHCFEAFDRTMRDIIRSPNRDKPFGGKVVVFGGDFRQILPVITKGTRADIVHASLHSSNLWCHCKVLTLTKNMRLSGGGANSQQLLDIQQFADWILKIGEGKINEPHDGETEIEFPREVLIQTESDPVSSIVNAIYPDLYDHIGDPRYFQDRAILAPTNEEVDFINEQVLSTVISEEHVYFSSDSLDPLENQDSFDQSLCSPENLNALKVPGVPNHRLALKTGAPIMLLRNIDQTRGLCNGTRLIVERLGVHVIEARIITGTFFGNVTYIPRMIISPSDSKIAFKFRRRQFPVSLCFAMTINKSQASLWLKSVYF